MLSSSAGSATCKILCHILCAAAPTIVHVSCATQRVMQALSVSVCLSLCFCVCLSLSLSQLCYPKSDTRCARERRPSISTPHTHAPVLKLILATAFLVQHLQPISLRIVLLIKSNFCEGVCVCLWMLVAVLEMETGARLVGVCRSCPRACTWSFTLFSP